ncbi:TVP38/TMEM64 family protein [Clostridium sp. WILCCON 0269]|uniref:TVP38/TMEM64 family membrane protein n=1 Tax=Candidatus Clostridium eludens TaxID=3381663 RepID=A0ABW8SDN5_9CLOT
MLKHIKKNLKEYKFYGLLLIVFTVFIISAYEYYSKYICLFTEPHKIKNIVMSYGKYGVIVFVFIQVLQVVAFFIPGEIVQIAGGYIYGVFGGSVVSILGITLGNLIAYGVSRIYGRPLVNKIISYKNLKFFQTILDLGSVNFIVFILYLIPGIPKDILAYICGISRIKFKNFVFYSTLGRLPGIIISVYFGSKIYSGDKIIIISIALVSIFLFIVGIFKGEKILVKILKDKNSQSNEQL